MSHNYKLKLYLDARNENRESSELLMYFNENLAYLNRLNIFIEFIPFTEIDLKNKKVKIELNNIGIKQFPALFHKNKILHTDDILNYVENLYEKELKKQDKKNNKGNKENAKNNVPVKKDNVFNNDFVSEIKQNNDEITPQEFTDRMETIKAMYRDN
jgi:hypothetical protein